MLDLHVSTTMGAGLKEAVLKASIIDDFKAGLRGALLCPDDVGYEDARKVWNGMIDRHPAMIVRCTGVADVLAAVRFACTYNLLVAVRGGGHNVAGHATCDGGLVIDLSPMKGVWVIRAGAQCVPRVGSPGASWIVRRRCLAWQPPVAPIPRRESPASPWVAVSAGCRGNMA